MPSIMQLKILRAIVEHQSIKAAAQHVHKTQPALSHAVKQVESELGVKMFDRSGYRLKPTPQGKVLYELALQVLKNHDKLLQTAKHFAEGVEEQIVLAIEASFPIEGLTRALQDTQQTFPFTNIVLLQEYLSGAIEKLQQEVAHIAITPLPTMLVQPNLFDTVNLSRGRLINVMAPSMLARHEPLVSVKQLVNEYQIVVRDSGGLSAGINLDVLPSQRYWYVNNFATKLSLIQQGMGWGKLPETIVAESLENNTLVHVPIDDFTGITNLTYKLAKRKGQVLGPVAKMLWDQLSLSRVEQATPEETNQL